MPFICLSHELKFKTAFIQKKIEKTYCCDPVIIALRFYDILDDDDFFEVVTDILQ